MKSLKKCGVLGCSRLNASGQLERDKAKRFCHMHNPQRLAQLAEARAVSHTRRSRVSPKTACRASAAVSGERVCSEAGSRCLFGPSWCPYTRSSHWYWVKTARARCETCGGVIAGLVSRIPFNMRGPQHQLPRASGG